VKEGKKNRKEDKRKGNRKGGGRWGGGEGKRVFMEKVYRSSK